MKKASKSNNGPGRPKYTPIIPKGKFTFTDLEIANGVNPNTGKGKACTTLTLRKWLKRELSKRGHSAVIHLKDVLADPNGKNGIGRKQYVYQKRVGTAVTATPKEVTPKVQKTRKVNVDVDVDSANINSTDVVSPPSDAMSKETLDYEAKKAALLAPVVSIAEAPLPDAPQATEVVEPATEPTKEASAELPTPDTAIVG